MSFQILKQLSSFQMEKHKALSMLIAFCLGCFACLAINEGSPEGKSESRARKQIPTQDPDAASEFELHPDSNQSRAANHFSGAQPFFRSHDHWPVPSHCSTELATQSGWLVESDNSLVSLKIRLQI